MYLYRFLWPKQKLETKNTLEPTKPHHHKSAALLAAKEKRILCPHINEAVNSLKRVFYKISLLKTAL